MITVHLLRHGETEWHAESRYAGVSDVALTERGRQQGRDLAGWAGTAGIGAVATSDLSRAIQTGEPLAAAADAPLMIEPGLREVDFGRGEGLTRHEMRKLFPAALEAFLAAPATSPLPDAEFGTAAAARGLATLAAVAGRVDDGQALVVVAHSTLIRLLLCQLLGLPLDDYRRRFPRVANTSLTTILMPASTGPAELVGMGELLRFNAPIC